MKRILFDLFSSLPINFLALIILLLCLVFVQNLWFWKIVAVFIQAGLILVNVNLTNTEEIKAVTDRRKRKIRNEQ